jgi:predicted dehydrogenase/threonine dehydrogenase-like Zn-dependent dehydrogenase
MKALLEDTRSGQLRLVEVPRPELRPGGILVQTHFSAVSSGTELAKLETGQKSLLGKALARPDLVRRVLTVAREEGVASAYQKVQSRLDSLTTLGYSCSGIVLGTGEDVTEFQPGDRVACAGVGFANHCEVNFIPRNLAVRVPPEVSLQAACLTTIGAIAMQGLRQSQIVFGETVAVIGAGLVGLLTIQLARAAGCRVIALDIDAGRAKFAHTMGAHLALVVGDPRNAALVDEYTGHGADVAVITASAASSEPIELAAELIRDRGRIVVVGDVGLGVSRRSAYAKELSVVLSRSYGPGRYDVQYEEKGIDYPIGYVRWTEHRNMQAFVNFLAAGAIDVTPLLQIKYPLSEAEKAYAQLREKGGYTAIIEYPADDTARSGVSETATRAVRRTSATQGLRVSCIGAGSFASDVIIPYLSGRPAVILESVATASGITAESARARFGFRQTQTPEQVLQDPATDAVFVFSRHDSHADYVVKALHQHKPVFVEKPLASNRQQLEDVKHAYRAAFEKGGSPFLMVGFNRRFAPLTTELRRFFAGRRESMLVQVRVNAGYLPRDHWTHEDGGRIVGEFCHFIDWARCVVDSPIERVQASALPDGTRYQRDNVLVSLRFEDGSIASLLYLANGDKTVAKERFEVFCEGSVAQLDDFRVLSLTRNAKTRQIKLKRDKGHRRELELTLEAIRSGGAAPIPFQELVEVTETTFAIHRAIASDEVVTAGTGVPALVSKA